MKKKTWTHLEEHEPSRTKTDPEDEQVENMKHALGRDLYTALELATIKEKAMTIHQITVERETAILNIAYSLKREGILNMRRRRDLPRLEPYLSLAPAVNVIADALDKAIVIVKRKKA